jgi:hypothetical protein
LQSAFFVHAAQTPAMHVCPLAQSVPLVHLPHWLPPTQPSPGSQSEAFEHEQPPPWHVAVGPHCMPVVHCPQTPAVHTWPWSQSTFEPHAGVHVPDAQASPVAQSPLEEQEQYRLECVAVHWALGPHWSFVEQLPHVPPLHTSPAGHWLFVVQAPVVPLQLPPAHAVHTWYD